MGWPGSGRRTGIMYSAWFYLGICMVFCLVFTWVSTCLYVVLPRLLPGFYMGFTWVFYMIACQVPETLIPGKLLGEYQPFT